MKHLLLLLSLFLLGNLAFSQSYRPFIEEGKYWDVFYRDWSHPCFFEDFRRYSLGNDTIISGKNYVSLGYFEALDFPTSICDLSYVVFDTLLIRTGYYFREDTAEKEVFLYDESSKREALHYDFSLQIGDTIKNLERVIDSISTETLFDGTAVSVFYWDESGHAIAFLAEGVGSLGGPLDPFFGPGTTSLLTCSGIKTKGPLWGQNCNSHFVSVQAVKKEAFQLYPNPSQGTIRFAGEAIPGSVELIDSQGKLILNSAVPSSGQIELGKQQSGLYFIRLFDEKGKLQAYEKLIISSQ